MSPGRCLSYLGAVGPHLQPLLAATWAPGARGWRGVHRAKCNRGLRCSAQELPAQGVFRTPRPLLPSDHRKGKRTLSPGCPSIGVGSPNLRPAPPPRRQHSGVGRGGVGESSDPGRGAAADAQSDYLGARSDPPPRPPPCPNSNQAPRLRGGGDSRFVLQIRPRTLGEISARPGGERTEAPRDKRDAWGRYQTGAPPPKQLAHPSPAAPGAAAWRGQAQNPPSLGSHCGLCTPPLHPAPLAAPPVEHNTGLACKMASKCISKKNQKRMSPGVRVETGPATQAVYVFACTCFGGRVFWYICPGWGSSAHGCG